MPIFILVFSFIGTNNARHKMPFRKNKNNDADQYFMIYFAAFLNNSDMHYLVTGGAGFIGSHVVQRLLETEKGVSVTCIDNFDPFYSREIKELNISPFKDDPNFRLLNCDLSATTAKQLDELVESRVDVIIHLAAKAGVRPSILDPLSYQQANVIGLQNLLDFAKERNVKQFVFASSSSVYGVNDHFPWREDEKLLPISPYAMTKLAGEMLGHVYSKLFDIRFIGLRFFTVYGPGQRPDLAIHKFTRIIFNGKPIPVYGDGSSRRDYTYIDDALQGIVAAAKYNQSNFEIINLGNNYSVSLRELINAVEQAVGKKAVIEQLPDQPGDVPKTFADISKAKKLLGYKPNTKLNEGLKRFFEWFGEHRELLLK
ncbi:MAG TPA: GDP-mannose 4,6-dehydratase [Chitinophagaceae bacterium]|nr:GDP-mannose 4,6-dehydratase [Chitinophagaceae bacterium]